MKYYLAYGSNLNKGQMKYRCPDAVPVDTALLLNYHLVFRRGYLTIEPELGATVPVAIWKISDEDEKRLDRYEGFPRFYFKRTFQIETDSGQKECMAYIMVDGHPIQAPEDSYFYTVRRGYTDFGFYKKPLDLAYVEARYKDD